MGKKILVAFSTNAGSTEEVARAIAEVRTSQGDEVEIRRIEAVTSIETYDAVIVGAPMIVGWHRTAQNFVKKQREALSQRRVAYFCTAMSLTQTGENSVGAVPVCVDSTLARPPKNPQRLSLKEGYATVPNYVMPMLKAASAVHPVSVGVFGGKLELFRLPFLEMVFVMAVVQAQPGDLRNWTVIRQWASGLSL